jgi:hypothetical protein
MVVTPQRIFFRRDIGKKMVVTPQRIFFGKKNP